MIISACCVTIISKGCVAIISKDCVMTFSKDCVMMFSQSFGCDPTTRLRSPTKHPNSFFSDDFILSSAADYLGPSQEEKFYVISLRQHVLTIFLWPEMVTLEG